MIKTIRKTIADNSGATAIEYGLIAALVSVAGITALSFMGTELKNMFNTVGTQLQNATAGAGGGGTTGGGGGTTGGATT